MKICFKSIFDKAIVYFWIICGLIQNKETREWLFAPKDNDYCPHLWGWWVAISCRLRGHPAGVFYYNPNGLEPDMHCKNCGDDLG